MAALTEQRGQAQRCARTPSSTSRHPKSRRAICVDAGEAQSPRALFVVHLRTNVRTLENWERGRAKPNAQAALLINLVKQYPDTVQRSRPFDLTQVDERYQLGQE
jgi:putative transcriptional regulator